MRGSGHVSDRPKVEDTPCPRCGQKTLRIEWRLEVKPIGSFSLSGQQMKASALEWPWLVCGNCGVEGRGKRPGPQPEEN